MALRLVRILVPIALLMGLVGIAWWFQGELTRPARARSAAREADEGNTLHLRVGGALPRLEIEAPRPKPHRLDPVVPPPEPPPAPPQRRWVELRPGETISSICRREYGNTRRVGEILELNHLTEEGARRLRPGTRIYLPADG